METLENLIADTLARPVPPEIAAMAEHVRSCHSASRPCIAYGSCLRGVATTESLIDLYVLTGGLAGVSANPLSRMRLRTGAAQCLLRRTANSSGQRYRAKYAVLPLSLFARWMTANNPYFWARFAQPSALVYADARPASHESPPSPPHAHHVCQRQGSSPIDDALAVWTSGFAATYATELRAESAARAASLVAANRRLLPRSRARCWLTSTPINGQLAATAASPASSGPSPA